MKGCGVEEDTDSGEASRGAGTAGTVKERLSRALGQSQPGSSACERVVSEWPSSKSCPSPVNLGLDRARARPAARMPSRIKFDSPEPADKPTRPPKPASPAPRPPSPHKLDSLKRPPPNATSGSPAPPKKRKLVFFDEEAEQEAKERANGAGEAGPQVNGSGGVKRRATWGPEQKRKAKEEAARLRPEREKLPVFQGAFASPSSTARGGLTRLVSFPRKGGHSQGHRGERHGHRARGDGFGKDDS
jgi:hypothetical protein